jgi:hypothetical protein
MVGFAGAAIIARSAGIAGFVALDEGVERHVERLWISGGLVLKVDPNILWCKRTDPGRRGAAKKAGAAAAKLHKLLFFIIKNTSFSVNKILDRARGGLLVFGLRNTRSCVPGIRG